MRPRRATFFLLATLRSITNAQASNGPRLSVLYDRDGQSPCALEERVKSACPQPRNFEAPPTYLNQSALPCTCNVIFFNLWSACLLSAGNSILPRFDHWSRSCDLHSLNINTSPPNVYAIPLPPWAQMPKPNPTNTTFDVGNAIMIAQVSKGMPWTAVQIITPVLSALATVVILGCWYLYQYSPRRYRAWSRGGALFFRNSAHKVRERSRDEAWTIDLAEPPVNQHIAKGHNWPDDTGRHTPSTETNANFGSWKSSFRQFNRPPAVRSVTPGKGWSISSVDHSTEAGLSPKPAARGPTFAHAIIEDDSDDDIDDVMGGPRPEEARDETDQLLSPAVRSENNVFLISHRPGEDFTIESSHLSRNSSLAQGTNRGGQQRPVIDPLEGQPNIHPLRPPDRSIQGFTKPFSFLPKVKITMPGKSSRSDSRTYSNEQNPPSRAPSADNPSLPGSLSRQVLSFPELFPLAPIPSLIHSRSASLTTAHEQTLYSQLHPNRPQGSPSPFQSIHQQRSSQEEITFLRPQASHRRAASHDIRGFHPAMLQPRP
ncbi:hypothetical protein APHAL10511_003191 [Amanita phalloides]|nr:hypothetical protein APHAL10511_003191 [Amanita phalloides]